MILMRHSFDLQYINFDLTETFRQGLTHNCVHLNFKSLIFIIKQMHHI